MATTATTEISNFIGGEERPAADGGAEPIVNPATGEEIASAPLSGEEDVDAAVRAADEAFAEWSETPPGERALALLKIADLGVRRALDACPELRLGVNIAGGQITHPAVAEALGVGTVEGEPVR